MAEPRFVWCFDHATLHEGVWCPETWVPLAGASRRQAMDDKARRFGAAMTLFELAPDKRQAVIKQRQEATS